MGLSALNSGCIFFFGGGGMPHSVCLHSCDQKAVDFDKSFTMSAILSMFYPVLYND